MAAITRGMATLMAGTFILAHHEFRSHAPNIDEIGLAAIGAGDPQERGDSARPKDERIRTEEVRFRCGDNTLGGVLVLPEGPGPHPAIALVFGSGRTDRNYHGVAPHLWRHFARHGFACLAWDKPGVGKSTGDYNAQTFRDRADEALAAVRFLRGRAEVRKDRVGLWGHSQGGTVAVLAASLSGDVAFLIEVGGSQVIAWRQDSLRVEAELRADGFAEDDIREAVAFAQMRMDLIRGKGEFEDLEKSHATVEKRPWFEYAGPMRPAALLLGEEDGRVRPRPGLGEGEVPGPGDLRREGHVAAAGAEPPDHPPWAGESREQGRDDQGRPRCRPRPEGHEDGRPEGGTGAIKARKPGDGPDFAPGYLDLMTDWLTERYVKRP